MVFLISVLTLKVVFFRHKTQTLDHLAQFDVNILYSALQNVIMVLMSRFYLFQQLIRISGQPLGRLSPFLFRFPMIHHGSHCIFQ